MITFDRSARSVVAVCAECGTRDIFATVTAADRWAVDHVMTCGDPSEARTTFLASARQRRSRATRRGENVAPDVTLPCTVAAWE